MLNSRNKKTLPEQEDQRTFHMYGAGHNSPKSYSKAQPAKSQVYNNYKGDNPWLCDLANSSDDVFPATSEVFIKKKGKHNVKVNTKFYTYYII